VLLDHYHPKWFSAGATFSLGIHVFLPIIFSLPIPRPLMSGLIKKWRNLVLLVLLLFYMGKILRVTPNDIFLEIRDCGVPPGRGTIRDGWKNHLTFSALISNHAVLRPAFNFFYLYFLELVRFKFNRKALQIHKKIIITNWIWRKIGFNVSANRCLISPIVGIGEKGLEVLKVGRQGVTPISSRVINLDE